MRPWSRSAPPARPARYAAGLAAACLLAAGCSPGAGERALPPLSTGAPGQTFAPADPGPTATPTPTAREVPRQCGDLLPVSEVLRIVGVPLKGEGTFVYAGPLPDVGRTGRITCGYGAEPAGGDSENLVPKVEITLNGYVDAATARGRLDGTVAAAQAEGQALQALDLAGRPGFVLGDEVDTTYVLADGSLTLVVTVARGVVPARALRAVLVELAAGVLGLPATATPAATPAATADASPAPTP